MDPQGPHARRSGPPSNEKLGLRDALAYVIAALGLVLPYVGIAVAVFVLILLVVRRLG